MIINWENGGSPHARVFDANGLEWTECLEVDTETGRVERLVTGADGSYVYNDDYIALRREIVIAAVPLLVVPTPS